MSEEEETTFEQPQKIPKEFITVVSNRRFSSPNKRVIVADCDDLPYSDMRRSDSCMDYKGMVDIKRPSERLKLKRKISYDHLEGYYFCQKVESKPAEEKPLDLSSVLKVNTKTYNSRMNGNIARNKSPEIGLNNDDVNSCDNEAKRDCLVNYSPAENAKRPFQTETVFQQTNESIPWRDRFKLKQLEPTISSGSEDEYRPGRLIRKYRSSVEAIDSNSQPELLHSDFISPEGKKLPSLPNTANRMPPLPNDNSENGFDSSRGKNDKFSIQDLLGPKPPASSVYMEENFPPRFISPGGQLLQMPPSMFPVVANGIFNSSVKNYFQPSTFSNYMHLNSPVEIAEYSKFYPYPPIPQSSFPPRSFPTNQEGFSSSKSRQKTKEQRPFKTIDPESILRQLDLSEPVEILEQSNQSAISMPAVSTAVSSPQRLSPDSQCQPNSSSGNSNETVSQDASGEPEKKKIRRIPPEEQDAKYLEKRRKNNLAAKKSRDERRRKEDYVSASLAKVSRQNIGLVNINESLKFNIAEKERILDMVKARLVTFREKCDVSTRRLFDDHFGHFLPH